MLSFGLIGCGNIGKRHAELMNRYGKLVSVCDLELEKARTIASEYGANFYIDFHSMLKKEKFDLVAICTPNGLHAEHSIAAMDAGFHVLCEKPMALSIRDGERMIEVSEMMSKLLLVVKQNRYNPPVVELKQLLDEGRLGNILSVQVNCYWNRPESYYKDSWHGKKDMDGGVLFTQFSHFIDLLYWMFGGMRKVSGRIMNQHHKGIIEIEDQGILLMEFERCQLVGMHYTINSYSRNMEGSITVFGEMGTVKIGGQYLNKLEYQDLYGERMVVDEVGMHSNQYGKYEGSMSNHEKVYKNILDIFEKDMKGEVNVGDAFKTVEIIESIYSSIKMNQYT